MTDTVDHAGGSPGDPSDGSVSGVRSRLRRYRELRLTEEELATALLTPVVCFLLLISFYPIVDTVWGSFHQGYVLEMEPTTFVGLENYEAVLSSGSFWNALQVSLIYTFVSVPIELVIGLGMALLLNRAFTGKYVVQAAILFPWALPTVINAKIWAWMLHGQYGVVNDLLIRLGVLQEPYAFLAHPDVALASMTLITIWKTSSFMALILLAGLSGIPDHLYEAVRMDGASRWRQFRDITLPLLKPTILVALIFRTLPAFQAFGLPYGLTGGGPAEATTTLVLYDQQLTFTQLAFGRGSAVATIITLIALVISLLYVGTLYEPEVR
ncbi:carbohydrate ABC transporter permease [Halomarina pelagica]|uniref:carbohydrate ABC transporter permease n=1 Tax=Halomarina pelagica TaxID=2961599 RepID=UPI0020C4CF8D|nr:sugar ABC transporter permease [Halomarina sp. BND7]